MPTYVEPVTGYLFFRKFAQGLCLCLSSCSGGCDKLGVPLIAGAEGWTGTTLPSRNSSLIQRFADEHFPLPSERARRMLTILDLLVDLGDRRSSALQQSEAFRSLQRR